MRGAALVGIALALITCKKERVPAPSATSAEAPPVSAVAATAPPPTAPPVFEQPTAPATSSAPAAAGQPFDFVPAELARGDTITLERTMCFGSCPAYEVTLRGDGVITWAGHSSVDTKHASAKADPTKVRAIFDYAMATSFFGLRDSYRGGVTDHPSARVTVKSNGRSKTVEVNPGEASYAKMTGAPPSFYELANRIDALANSKKYIGAGRER